MSLEEIICLENIIDKKSTYYVIDLNLSKLVKQILKKGKNGVIPILETRLLLHSFIYIPFSNENEGT